MIVQIMSHVAMAISFGEDHVATGQWCNRAMSHQRNQEANYIQHKSVADSDGAAILTWANLQVAPFLHWPLIKKSQMRRPSSVKRLPNFLASRASREIAERSLRPAMIADIAASLDPIAECDCG